MHSDDDKEMTFDPWHGNLPETVPVNRKADEPKAVRKQTHRPGERASLGDPEDRTKPSSDVAPLQPLPFDAFYVKQLRALEEEDASMGPASVEEGADRSIEGVGYGADEGLFDIEDFETACANFDEPDAETWAENFEPPPDFEADLPDYDADARQSVWVDDPDDAGNSPLPARQRAADVVSRLSEVSLRERTAILLWLTDLFRHRNHHTTYRAILAAVDSGVSSETLRNMAALRDVWEDRPEWWLGRYGWARAVVPLRNGGTALTWKLARLICEARSDFPPEYMIDDAWVHEWLRRHPYDECRDFPQYIKMKVMAIGDAPQPVPSSTDWQLHESNEFGDTRNQVENAFDNAERHTMGY